MSDDRPAATKRRRSPRGEGYLLRSELIEATCRLLERGVTDAELSMRAVTREAGVAATTAYLQFADREELLWAVSETLFAELAAAMDEATAATTTPQEQLRAIALAHCRFGLDHPAHYRVLFAVVPIPKTPRALEELPGGAVFARFESAVRDNLGDGTDPETVRTKTILLWATLHGLVSLRSTKPQFPWPNIDALVDAALADLAT